VAIRRRAEEEEFVAEGDGRPWLPTVAGALGERGFTAINVHHALRQVDADYRSRSLRGKIVVTLLPGAGNVTSINARAIGEGANLRVGFASPGRRLIARFRDGLAASLRSTGG